MAKGFKHGAGGGTSLNFKVVGGTSAPSNPKDNTIWVDTDAEITGWHFGAEEPNVYNIQPLAGDPWNLICPDNHKAGKIINFTIPKTVSSTLEAIRLYHAGTDKMYCIRQFDGSVAAAWPAGAKVSVILSDETYEIGDWVGNGTARILAWEEYYHKEGTVWILTGTSSSTAFNALKKNGITVYPISAKQYASGAWVDKVAKSYQRGEWVGWIMHLYTPGNEHTDKTGGWVAKALPAGNASTALPTITRNSDDIRFALSGTGGKGGVCYLKNKIVLSGRKTVRFYGHTNNTSRDTIRLRIWSAIGATSDDNVAASTSLFEKPNFDATPVTLDVSALSGEYYIGVQLIGYEGSQPILTITQIEVE